MCCDVHLQQLKKKSRSVSRPRMVAERCWNHDGGTCAEVATAGRASGSTACSGRTSSGSADATTNDDRCGQSSTNCSYPNCPGIQRKIWLISGLETSRRRSRVKRMSTLGGRRRAPRGTCGCGSESVASVALISLRRNERDSLCSC